MITKFTNRFHFRFFVIYDDDDKTHTLHANTDTVNNEVLYETFLMKNMDILQPQASHLQQHHPDDQWIVDMNGGYNRCLVS